ncbi:hypothetical protein FRC10_011118 [Ceratobasidium sp. 414]|nr:hypothetical protein FRC10_011118 [Ceratobasidium sp. 414]
MSRLLKRTQKVLENVYLQENSTHGGWRRLESARGNLPKELVHNPNDMTHSDSEDKWRITRGQWLWLAGGNDEWGVPGNGSTSKPQQTARGSFLPTTSLSFVCATFAGEAASMSWQEELRQRLVERNAEESAYSGIIEQYRRLAQQARLLSERNSTLLRAVGNPVRVAYVASLESQITSLRDELAAVYKTQGQNAQRLLSMNETLREKEEQTRGNLEELRQVKEEVERLRRTAKDHKEQIEEKNRALQTLIDDAQTYQLEISQVEARNEDLKKDNAGLLQRWLDHMNEAANKMNHANTFYSDLRTAGWASQPASTATSELDDDIVNVNGDQLSASGKEERNGAPSTSPNMLQLNPNG